MVPKLLTGEETTVYGDSGYLSAEKRDDAIIRNTKGKRSNTRSTADRPRARTSLSFLSTNQASRTRKVICQGKGRACVRSSKGAAWLPKNTIPRSAETDRKIEYAVCHGKSDSGWQALPGSLMKCCLKQKLATKHDQLQKSASSAEWLTNIRSLCGGALDMLSFLKINTLYEVYVLTKLINYFKNSGYTLKAADRIPYPSPGKKIENTYCKAG